MVPATTDLIVGVRKPPARSRARYDAGSRCGVVREIVHRVTTAPHSLASIKRVEAAAGSLATTAARRMNDELSWFRDLPPKHRSIIGLIAHSGIAAFVDWLRQPKQTINDTGTIFGAAPREFARLITLQQTVEMVRLTIDVVEQSVDELAAPGEETALKEAVLRFSREVAFAAADVYAKAAEERGAWHARLRALLVDALLRGDAAESLQSRAAAMGWGTPDGVAVLAGPAPDGDPDPVLDEAERRARHVGVDALAGLHGDRLVVVLGGSGDLMPCAAELAPVFGKGPIVMGPTVATLIDAAASATAALNGLRVAAGWPDAPRPVSADDLLPERALDGDKQAAATLVEDIYNPLATGGPALLETVTAFLAQGGSIEGTARAMYLHPNTVRYRLRRAIEVCGVSVYDARGAFVVQVAITLGRIAG
ncbi:MAG: helix-turn-helix domain-containing protein [Actinomycetota bacterium]